MVRAAAKNHPSVAVVTSPSRYADVLAAVARRRLHARAAPGARRRGVRAHRDLRRRRRVVARQRRRARPTAAPASRRGSARPGSARRCCATARTRTSAPRSTSRTTRRDPGLAQAEQLHGKEMSYNNYVDADAARRAAYDHAEPAVAIIKHANPCGIAVGADIAEAHAQGATTPTRSRRSAASSPRTARSPPRWRGRSPRSSPRSSSRPAFDDEALEILQREEEPPPARRGRRPRARRHRDPAGVRRPAAAGDRQGRRAPATTRRRGRSPAASAADEATLRDLAFAWRACRSVKSNAILLAKDGAAVGVGMGQVNRVDSAPARGRAGRRRARARLGRGVGRVLPVPRRPRGADRGGRAGRRAARRIGARRRGHRRGHAPPASRCTSPGPAISSTDRIAPSDATAPTHHHHPPLWAMALAFAVGVLAAAQSRINGQLAIEVQDGLLAALISFGTGLVARARDRPRRCQGPRTALLHGAPRGAALRRAAVVAPGRRRPRCDVRRRPGARRAAARASRCSPCSPSRATRPRRCSPTGSASGRAGVVP